MTQYVAVQGDFERLIRLESGIETVYSYFTDFNYILTRLPEIDRVLRYSDGRYRMVFMADDGRGHEMGIVFDIRHELNENRHIRMVSLPLTEQDLRDDPRMSSSHSHGPLFPGRFAGETIFYDRGTHSEVVYRAQLNIEIEVPRFLSFMPRKVLQQIGDTLMKLKLHTVGDGLAQNMVEEFEGWRELNQEKLLVQSGSKSQKVVQEQHSRSANEYN